MSRVVLVVGTGRSGTSAVSGVLHKLGIPMGIEFVPADKNNRLGTYEDVSFFRRSREGLGTGWLDEYVSIRSEDAPIWGVKDPHLTMLLGEYLPFFGDDVRIVVAHRNREATINSVVRAYGVDRTVAEERYDVVHNTMVKFLSEYGGAYIVVDFDALVAIPEVAVSNIVDFVFDGMEPPGEDDIFDAIRHIKPNFVSWDKDGKWQARYVKPAVDGWGRIAIGTRIAKFPEYHFFLSWTKLLTGGTRPGDAILMPRGWMPAHWAGSEVVREFLESEQNSLLFVDDDMIFEQDELERLRSNKANWDYDIVAGFCTKRDWPPLPVTFRLLDPQPPIPVSLNGDAFDRVVDVEDGDIIDVDATGLAFTLIKRHVLEAMTNEYGPNFTDYFMYDRGRESEDIYFFRRARELGFRIGIDTIAKPYHIGQKAQGWTDFKSWMARQSRPDVVEFNAVDLIPILEEAIPLLDANKDAAINALRYIGGDGD